MTFDLWVGIYSTFEGPMFIELNVNKIPFFFCLWSMHVETEIFINLKEVNDHYTKKYVYISQPVNLKTHVWIKPLVQGLKYVAKYALTICKTDIAHCQITPSRTNLPQYVFSQGLPP